MSGSYRLSVDEQRELQKRVSRDSRLLRLVQVREQAKRASADRLQKYRERLDVSKCTVEKHLKEKWEQEKSTRLGALSEKYCKGACEVGGGHSAASANVLTETTNRIEANRKAKNLERKTTERFRAAIAVVKTENEARHKAVQDALCRRKERLDIDRKKAQVFGEQFKEDEKTRKRREMVASENEVIRRHCGQYSMVDFKHTRLHQLGVPTISEKHGLDDSEIGHNKAQEEARAEESRLREVQQKQHTQAAENAVTAKNRGDVALMREKAIRERAVIEQVLEQMQAKRQQKRKEALKRGELVEAPLLREWQTRKHKKDLQVAFEQVFVETGCGQNTFIQEDEELSEISMKDLHWSQGKGRRNARPPVQNAKDSFLPASPDAERIGSPPTGARKRTPRGPCSGQKLLENRTALKQAKGGVNMRYQHSEATPPGWFSEDSGAITTDLDDDALEPRSPPTVCPVPYPVASSSTSKESNRILPVSVASSSDFESVNAVGREALDSPGPSWLDDMLAPYLDKGDTLGCREKQSESVGTSQTNREKEEIKEASCREDGGRNDSWKESNSEIIPGANVDARYAPGSNVSEGSKNKSFTEPSFCEMALPSTEESNSEKEQHRSSSASVQSKRNINFDSAQQNTLEVETADAMSDALSQCTDNFIEEYLKEAAAMEVASKPPCSTSSDAESLATGQMMVAGNVDHRSLLSDLDLGSSTIDKETRDDISLTSFDIDKLLGGLGSGADGSSSVVSGISTVLGAMEKGADQATTSDSISISDSIMNPILSRSSIVRTAYGVSNARLPSAPSSTVTGITALLDPIPEGGRYRAPEVRELLPTASSSSQRETASDCFSALKASNGTESRTKSVTSPSSTGSLDGLLDLLDSVDCGNSFTLNNDDSGSVCSTILDTEAFMTNLSLGHASATPPRTPLTNSGPATIVPQTPFSVSTEATKIESYVSSPSRSASSVDWNGILHGPNSTTLNSSSCSAT